MRSIKLLLSVTIALTILFISCRKIDSRVNDIDTFDVEKFFNAHKSNDPLVQSTSEFVKRQNQKFHFVSNVINKVGIPYWNKSMIFSNSRNSKGTSLDTNYIYIPFARDTQDYVNSLLIVKTTSTDTFHTWVCDWQYQNYKFTEDQDTSLTAREVFNIFATFDNVVFGHEKFILLDKRLYSNQDSTDISSNHFDIDKTLVCLKLSESYHRPYGKNSVLTSLEICNTFERCLSELEPILHGFKMNRNNSGNCASGTWLVQEVCATVWIDIPGSGDSGDNGGGSSSSGSGNGWGPPSSGCGGSGKNALQSCGPGWTPLGGGGGTSIPPSPPNDSTIAQILKNAYLKIQSRADSLYDLGQNHTPYPWEYAATVNLDGGDTAISLTSIVHSLNAERDQVRSPSPHGLYWLLWHSHIDDGGTNNFDKNQCFSGGDIANLWDFLNRGQNFGGSIITSRDYVYAIYVVNKNTFVNYIKTLTGQTQYKYIEYQLEVLNETGRANCTGACSMQRQTELGALALCDNNNASTSGIRIFKSPKTNINFTLLQ